MKVHELMDLLKFAEPDAEVVLSRDPEGNGYMELGSVEVSTYNWDDSEAEIGLRKLTEEFKRHGFGEEDVMEDGVSCVVLWPW